MKRFTGLLLLISGLLLSGCGEKIAIPEPVGLFSVKAYLSAATYEIDTPKQMVIVEGAVFVIHGNTLSKRNQGFELMDGVEPVSTFGNPTSICGDAALGLVFVYDQTGSTVSWYNLSGLEFAGSTALPEVLSGVSMVTNDNGVEQVPDAQTFLYLGDTETEVIHRFSFDEITGLSPYGILARADGQSARFVHESAAMANEPGGTMVVCDADSLRNWVIRFSSEPDVTDTTVDPDDQDPLRGLAVPMRTFNCLPLPTAAYVLGDAPECEESDWVGGPSDIEAEFTTPQGIDVDGSGRIFVADTGNNRIQVFIEGELEQLFVINEEGISRPTAVAILDRVVSPFTTHFGAYIYVVLAEENLIRKFISFEEFQDLNPGTPPPPQ